MKKSKLNIFISPLDWGLGHITRIIPVVQLLKDRGHHVILGGGRNAGAVLRSEFPDLEFEPLPSCAIRYPHKGSLVWSLLKQMPRFFATIRREKKKIEKIIRRHQVDVVISDNRYGLYNKDVYSIFITHQLMIKLPPSVKFLEKWLYLRHQRMISKFDVCWVPDYARPPYLSGDLSHLFTPPSHVVFVGPLSRFSVGFCDEATSAYEYEVIAIMSGPEPARSRLEESLAEQLENTGKKCLLVRGLPNDAEKPEMPANIETVNHLPACTLKEKIMQSKNIIARAGYSTIMDLVAIGRTAILVPTPGQTEQEYLAQYYNERKLFLCFSEKELNVAEALNQITLYNWNMNKRSCQSLETEVGRIEKLLGSK